MKMKLFVCLLAMNFTASLGFAHGEDKYGPNGGFVRMPGAFHTELVPAEAGQVKVYLLDINWKNPITKNTKLEMAYKGSTVETAKCEIKADYYSCRFSNAIDLKKKGQIQLLAEREGQKGQPAVYELPLKLGLSTPAPAMDHSSHH